MSHATQPIRPTQEDRQAIRLLVRMRDDFQAMRKRMDNRIGRKADGEAMDIDERQFRPEDLQNFATLADAAKTQEAEIEKMLKKLLKRFPVYTEFMRDVKGLGHTYAAWIIAEIDIHEASTVSKLWQFAGLNPAMVRGKVRKEHDDGSFELVTTDKMIRGDKLTKGFVAPYNSRLRTALAGVMADCMIKSRSEYAIEHYYPYKCRLEHSDKIVTENVAGGKTREVAWKDATPMHRHRAAIRYMVKMFLRDLYRTWRELEGLEVRPDYHEEKLGHQHDAA